MASIALCWDSAVAMQGGPGAGGDVPHSSRAVSQPLALLQCHRKAGPVIPSPIKLGQRETCDGRGESFT